MHTDAKVILVGGTSHVGKSTVAKQMAETLGWRAVSTDSLARYPGRPWSARPEFKDEVREHYLSHDAEALVEGQLAHYRRMWPLVEALIREHLGTQAEPLVLEGSGVWPDSVVALQNPFASAVWLTAAPELIEARILSESRFDAADEENGEPIRRFIARSQGYDVRMMQAVRRLRLPFVTVAADDTAERVSQECLRRMRPLA